ncbi:hypothetical protein L596_012447 [Steinernema carpocapsae]|uniref:Uncharacterized protein n=1 Tax=Steinernema carpocapsae TaxID=34508 RepID=A0A4U5NXW7_STECR|nr:hypothetical protein L596_012447 [Steinernema carpocapsae]
MLLSNSWATATAKRHEFEQSNSNSADEPAKQHEIEENRSETLKMTKNSLFPARLVEVVAGLFESFRKVRRQPSPYKWFCRATVAGFLTGGAQTRVAVSLNTLSPSLFTVCQTCQNRDWRISRFRFETRCA